MPSNVGEFRTGDTSPEHPGKLYCRGCRKWRVSGGFDRHKEACGQSANVGNCASGAHNFKTALYERHVVKACMACGKMEFSIGFPEVTSRTANARIVGRKTCREDTHECTLLVNDTKKSMLVVSCKRCGMFEALRFATSEVENDGTTVNVLDRVRAYITRLQSVNEEIPEWTNEFIQRPPLPVNTTIHYQEPISYVMPTTGPPGTCAICMDRFGEEPDPVARSTETGDILVFEVCPCQHIFHRDCLMACLIRRIENCPLCRTHIEGCTYIIDGSSEIHAAPEVIPSESVHTIITEGDDT